VVGRGATYYRDLPLREDADAAVDPEQAAAALVEAVAGEAPAGHVVDALYEAAEGNPFFTEELLKALLERGFVSQVRGRWETRVSDKIDVPRSVRWVLGQRVKRLASGAQ